MTQKDKPRKRKPKRWCRKRDWITLILVKIIMIPYFFIKMGFRFRFTNLRLDRPYLILCNHQTFWDPGFLTMMYNRPIHFMATDNLFTNGFGSKLLTFFFGPIPKRKQGGDIQAVRAALKIAAEGGVVGVFPEGSTTYDGRPTSIDIGIAQLARKMKADLALCNIEGGYGSDPRWAAKTRWGYLTSRQVQVLTAEEIAAMTDEELLGIITEKLTVSPPPSEHRYFSRKRAEYIESAVYICPRCGAVSTIVSYGTGFRCTACGLTGTYNEDLTFSFDDSSVKITLMSEWMDMQKEHVARVVTDYDRYIFEDDGVRFTISDRSIGKRVILGIGYLRLDNNAVSFCMSSGSERTLELSTIDIVSPVSGRKLIISTRENTYFLIGGKGFNPYKYAQAIYYLKGEGIKEIK